MFPHHQLLTFLFLLLSWVTDYPVPLTLLPPLSGIALTPVQPACWINVTETDLLSVLVGQIDYFPDIQGHKAEVIHVLSHSQPASIALEAPDQKDAKPPYYVRKFGW